MSNPTAPCLVYNFTMDEMTIEKIHFAVFVIDAMSEEWGLSTYETYRILKESGLLDGYVLDLYDVVHTLGKDAIVEDVREKIKSLGYSDAALPRF